MIACHLPIIQVKHFSSYNPLFNYSNQNVLLKSYNNNDKRTAKIFTHLNRGLVILSTKVVLTTEILTNCKVYLYISNKQNTSCFN